MQSDAVEILLRKAKQDEIVLQRLLRDREVDDDTLGFHAQQAAEKLLKAALAARELEFPRTHNLGTLIDLLATAGVALPVELSEIDRLTPFGTVFRYDQVFSDEGQDRSLWLAWIRSLRSFVEAGLA